MTKPKPQIHPVRFPVKTVSGILSFIYLLSNRAKAQNSNNTIKALACRHLGFGALLVTFLAVFFFFSSPGYASPFKGPWDEDNSKKTSRKKIDHRLSPFGFLVQAYRTYVSPIDGRNCPMYPTCSQYSLRCFEKHGSFIGWMMTCDRLYRCGRDELQLSPWITVNGEIRCYDPLENNDFWWAHGH